MFFPGAAIFARQLLPSAILSSRPEEIGSRLFFRQTAPVFFKGSIHGSVSLDALIGVCHRLQRVWFGGGAYVYCVCWVVDGSRQPVSGSAIFLFGWYGVF